MLSDRFAQALDYAFALHREQERKVNHVPYLAHLLGVAATVMTYGGDEDTAIAALLHDAVEDQGGLPVADEIERRFGPRVRELVLAVSDATTTPKPPWRARKEQALAHLAEAPREVCLLKAADLLDNGRSILKEHRAIGPALWTHFRGGREGTLWYYRSVFTLLQTRLGGPLVAELEQAVAAIERLE